MVSEPFVINFQTGIAKVHQQNISLMLLRLSERVPVYSLKVDIIFPLKFATKGQKMHVIYADDAIILLNFIFSGLHGYQITPSLSTNKQRHRLLLLKTGIPVAPTHL